MKDNKIRNQIVFKIILLACICNISLATNVFAEAFSKPQIGAVCTSGFTNCPPSERHHQGRDYQVTLGSKNRDLLIYAIGDGVVTDAKTCRINGLDGSYGTNVTIKHTLERGGELYSFYAHMHGASLQVKVGDKVKKGSAIGVQGGTGECHGDSTWPHSIFEPYVGDNKDTNTAHACHLHFEIKSGNSISSHYNGVKITEGWKMERSDGTAYDPAGVIDEGKLGGFVPIPDAKFIKYQGVVNGTPEDGENSGGVPPERVVREYEANSKNYTNSNRTTIKYLVVHYTSNPDDRAWGNCNYFNEAPRKASAHYFVDEKEVWQSVDEKDVAWHCGSDTYYHPDCRNSNSIGVEMCTKIKNGTAYFEAETVKRTQDFLGYLMKKHNIPISNIVRHYDVTHKICPAPLIDEAKWQEFLKGINQNADYTYTYEPGPKDGKTGNDYSAGADPNVDWGVAGSAGGSSGSGNHGGSGGYLEGDIGLDLGDYDGYTYGGNVTDFGSITSLEGFLAALKVQIEKYGKTISAIFVFIAVLLIGFSITIKRNNPNERVELLNGLFYIGIGCLIIATIPVMIGFANSIMDSLN